MQQRKGALIFEIRDWCKSSHLWLGWKNFHRESAYILFFGNKKIAFKSSLDLHTIRPLFWTVLICLVVIQNQGKIQTMAVADVSKGRLWLEVVLPDEGDYLHGGGERLCLVGTRGYEETMCFTNTCYHPLTPSAPPLPVQLFKTKWFFQGNFQV